MEKNTKENRLEGLKDFFKEDIKAKHEMIDLAPTSLDTDSKESRISYTDKVDNFLKSFKLQIKLILNKLGINNIDEQIDLFFEQKNKELSESLSDLEGIEIFYQKSISNMDMEFIESVKKNIVGYSMENGNLSKQLANVKTINELLHLLHSYVINNEELLKSLPKIENRKVYNPYSIGDFGIDITLYGDNNKVSKELFDNFPQDSKAGIVDIVGLDNNVLIMAKDLGHALTIDIDLKDSKPLVNYFVPKVCNKDMAFRLPGINKITENGATGTFEVEDVQKISDNIFDFMDNVPTDFDIVYDDKIVNEDEVEKQNERKFNEDDLKNLASTRKISEVKTIIGKLKDKILKKDTIDKTRK